MSSSTAPAVNNLRSDDLSPLRSASDVEKDTLVKCRDIIQDIVKKRQQEGMSAGMFFFGVLNVIILSYLWGAQQAHFCVVYIVQSMILFPMRFKRASNTKPLSSVLYWFDFCWMANFFGQLLLLGFFIKAISMHYFGVGSFGFAPDIHIIATTRKMIFCMLWGISCGVLFMATSALGTALVFHNVDQTIGCFIHYFPALVLYALRWKSEIFKATYPGMFELNYLDQITWKDILIPSLGFYLTWWIVYSVWLVTIGLRLPKKGKYDTVFHSILRGGGPITAVVKKYATPKGVDFKKQQAGNDFTTKQAMTYMVLHMLACSIGIAMAIPFFYHKWLFNVAAILNLCSMVWQGSIRYEYFMTKLFVGALQKEIDAKEAKKTK